MLTTAQLLTIVVSMRQYKNKKINRIQKEIKTSKILKAIIALVFVHVDGFVVVFVIIQALCLCVVDSDL